jgi:hypothetical protein
MSIETVSRSIMSVRNSNYGPEDVIDVLITPEECSLLNSSETTIRFIINMIAPAGQPAVNCCSQLDGLAGGYAVFDTIQIFSGSDQNTLLEQLDNVNDFMSMYQHYSQTPGMNNFWSLTAGKCPNDENDSLYYRQTGLTNAADFVPKPVECVLKMPMSGIIGGDGKLFPCVLTGGLRIRISLASAAKSVSCHLPAIGKVGPRDASPAVGATPQPPPNNTCYALATAIAGAAQPLEIDIKDAGAVAVANTRAGPTADTCPIKKGQLIYYRNDAGDNELAGTVDTVSFEAGSICRITLDAAFPGTAATVNNFVWIGQESCTSSWTMSNFEILTSCAEPDPGTLKSMMAKAQAEGGLAVDYPSYNLLRDNLNANISNPQVNVLTSEKRALSILQTPIDPRTILYTSAFQPVGDGAEFYQYNISNRLTPNRQVDVKRVAGVVPDLQFNAVHGSELEKALRRGGIEPRYQCNNKAFFTIGRALSKDGHSFDANNHSIRLNLTYSTAATANTVNKLLLSQVRHIRRAIITTENVSVDF